VRGVRLLRRDFLKTGSPAGLARLAFRDVPVGSGRWWLLVGVFFGVMALHAGLDAMTDGGLGVAFFAPVDAGRWTWSAVRKRRRARDGELAL